MRRSLILLILLVGAAAWACGDKLHADYGREGLLIRPDTRSDPGLSRLKSASGGDSRPQTSR
jgi:hypothetical protein